MRIERRTGLGGSTQRLHQKEIDMIKDITMEGQDDEEPFSTKNSKVDV